MTYLSSWNEGEFHMLFQRLQSRGLNGPSLAQRLNSGMVAQKIIAFGLGSSDSNQNLYWALSASFSLHRKSELQQPIRTKAMKVLTPFC
jgi:hypothetical protein